MLPKSAFGRGMDGAPQVRSLRKEIKVKLYRRTPPLRVASFPNRDCSFAQKGYNPFRANCSPIAGAKHLEVESIFMVLHSSAVPNG